MVSANDFPENELGEIHFAANCVWYHQLSHFSDHFGTASSYAEVVALVPGQDVVDYEAGGYFCDARGMDSDVVVFKTFILEKDTLTVKNLRIDAFRSACLGSSEDCMATMLSIDFNRVFRD